MNTETAAVERPDPIDEALAAMLVRRAGMTGGDADLATAAIIRLSARRGEGHSALPIDDEPEGPEWTRALREGGLAGASEERRPLVLRDGLLQFRRYADAEERIAAQLRARVQATPPRLRIITGGPGSGKTTRVAGEIVARVTADPGIRIALAAPTGKAAARLTESIGARLVELEAPADVRRRIPADARTLHRLLGYQPWDDSFRYGSRRPLGEDLIIVDEASMIDVLMMDALLQAIREDAELVLVGDHRQLASVETGNVLGSIVGGPALRPVVTELTGNHRFASQPGIAAVAGAIREERIEEAVDLLRRGEHEDARCRPLPSTESGLIEPIAARLLACIDAATPREMLDALDEVRILCAEREGRLGVAGINAIVERWAASRGLNTRDRWYHGRPVLVGANDYAAEVFNGDLGVCWKREDGRVDVHLPTSDGGTQILSPDRLPAVTTAWAMTVHKSQGSEFGEVVLVLPQQESRLLTRELIYTGLTRAKRRVTVLGAEAVLRAGLTATAARQSGLTTRL